MQSPLNEIGVRLNIAAANEHVPEIERVIQTIKECNWASVSALPFKKFPKLLKCALIAHTVSCLNFLPHVNGLSATLSPRTIVTGNVLDFNTLSHTYRSIL
jgi:hypothetical protein